MAEAGSQPGAGPQRVAVLGVGLIGGSIGMAARRLEDTAVVGYDRDPATLGAALELGAIDEAAESAAAACAGADVIFCAAPVAALPEQVAAALGHSGPATVITDVGSTKRGLVESIAADPAAQRFIGGHPLAGAETAGVEGSRADLFVGARWYLTPTARSEGMLYDRLQRLLAGLGARPQAIDPAEHDRTMATISHLPHVLANALVSRAAETLGTSGERRPEVGRSFRDATRVAGANPAIWADIFGANSTAVADEIDAVVDRLRDASALIRDGAPGAIASWQDEARRDRRAMLESDLVSGPLMELRVAVQNRPGTVAEIALVLARAGVNIEDMSLFPAADQRTGAISLWIDGEAPAQRAAEIVAELGHQVSAISSAAS